MRFATGLGFAVALLAATTAVAKDTPQSVLDAAKALAGKGEALKAADRYGDAVALAQAAGDLQAEQAVADSLEEFIDEATRNAGRAKAEGGKASDVPSPAALLVAVLRKLDANRCGAFVSAPVLARNVLQLATETGEFAFVADAARVAAAHTSKTGSGRAAAVAAKYAEGMKAVADGKFDAATAPLEAAAAEAVKAGWLDLAAHAATESAACWTRLAAPDKAAAALASTASQFDDKCGIEIVGGWMSMARARMPAAPQEVTKPLDDLMARAGKNPGSGGSGSRGADGAPGGKGPRVSAIGKLLPKLPKVKPIVSAVRTAKGLEMHWLTKPDEKPLVEFADSYAYADDGGVWLAVYGHGTALLAVDLVGGQGGFGGKSRPSPARALYLLAEGETWSVSKDGVVTITR